jgi:hypothetical protein
MLLGSVVCRKYECVASEENADLHHPLNTVSGKFEKAERSTVTA